MPSEAAIASFSVDGKPYGIRRGRIMPNTPPFHVVNGAGAHVSLAFPEEGGGFLFDMLEPDGKRGGFRLGADRKASRFPTKAAYWKARAAAGWPALKKVSG